MAGARGDAEDGGDAAHRARRMSRRRRRALSVAAVAVGVLFALGGAAAERLASRWPAIGAVGRGVGLRTVSLALPAGVAAGALVVRSELAWWATGVYLLSLALLIVLVATDLEQRRLPHLVLDPLILVALAFVPFNPAIEPANALLGALGAVTLLAAVALIVRGGLARGDLLLVTPIGLLLGFPSVFIGVFAAAFLAAASSLVLLAARRVGMRSYIPFGPFLVGGAVIVLLFDERVLSAVR